MKGSRRADNRRPKWHDGNGEVALQPETNVLGQTVLVIPRRHIKEVGGNGSAAWYPQKPYSHQLNSRLRKRIKTLLHIIVTLGVVDPESIDPYVEDVSAESECNWRGT